MANQLEHQLIYPLGDSLPPLGQTLEVAPGVRWVRMGLPFALDHINLWLLRDELDGRAGWTVVDCGVTNAQTQAAWEMIFTQQLQGLPVLRVIVTHMHPDHIGMAHWLTARWSDEQHTCRLWISATDWASAHLASSMSVDERGAGAARLAYEHGIRDERVLGQMHQWGTYYSASVPAVPESFRRLMDGQGVRIGTQTWRCIAGYGHAPEHISLYCAELGLMISGDMVLPRISTNVSVQAIEPEADVLGLYLASLEALRSVPDTTLVLPSHGKPFVGLQARIGQLLAHHVERLEVVRACCAETAHTAAEVMPVLFNRPLDLHQTTFALGETIAHLNYLWLAGELQRVRRSDRAWVFRRA